MRHYHFTRVRSTNDTCKHLLRKHTHVVVTADTQTAGRGQHHRQWHSPAAGNLYCSIGHRHQPPIPASAAIHYLFLAALSLKATAELFASNHTFLLKYPNDLYGQAPEGWRKVGGILIENSFSGSHCLSTVIGIGVNISQRDFPPPLQSIATSFHLLGIPVSVYTVLSTLLTFYQQLQRYSSALLFQWWQEELCLHTLSVTIDSSSEQWTVAAVLTDGALQLVRADRKQIHHFSRGSIRYSLEAAFQKRIRHPLLTEKLKARGFQAG